jgi:flagellar basal-body rod modification protein FlgD
MASIESVLASTQAGVTTTGTTPATSKADTQKNQFLQLLVAQLKGQNPLDPLDGTQFVSQLAQFSSLEELTGIHAAMENVQKYLKPVETSTATDTTKIF